MQYSKNTIEYALKNSSVADQDAPTRTTYSLPFKRTRMLGFFIAVILTSIAGVGMMFDILRANGTTALELCLLVLFSFSFIWITTAFWSGFAGFLVKLFKIDPLTLKKQAIFSDSSSATSLESNFYDDNRAKLLPSENFRTAVVMPVYNEDTVRVLAGFETTLRSLETTGQLSKFDFFLLSDTQDPKIRVAELQAWKILTKRLGALSKHIFYRNRVKNTEKKVGNLKDFCERWGTQYEAMIVLDADSIMTGDCMVRMAAELEKNTGVGLIQTVPMPVRQTTFFGRFLQFAAELCSPMLASGLAFWQTDNANYWGHNAIIRVNAFIDCCGLPRLPGKAPFGGDILSHDFVEAALLRRAGWDVILLPDLKGSFEEVPSNILDYATRDRRWIQGNLQHLALLGMHRSTLMSKCHFLFGALAYISSLIWLVMLALSSVDAIVRSVTETQFFTASYQLFPNWPVAKTELIFSLLFLTTCMLLLPKFMALIITSMDNHKSFGGHLKLFLSAGLEIVFAILIAPIMMVFHASFVVATFCGFKISWDAQSREGRVVAWREAFRRTGLGLTVALIWGSVTAYYTPVFFWWLLPVLLGLVLAPAIIRYSSSNELGLFLQKHRIFAVPSEVINPQALVEMRKNLAELHEKMGLNQNANQVYLIPRLPPETPVEMKTQNFGKEPTLVPAINIT